jgi:hypothetical protein
MILLMAYCAILYALIGWFLVEKGFILSPGFPWNLIGLSVGLVAGNVFSTMIAIWLQDSEK